MRRSRPAGLATVILTAMRLLVVGFAQSIHTARYLQLLEDSGWEVQLFASAIPGPPHPDLPPVALHTCLPEDRAPSAPSEASIRQLPYPLSHAAYADQLARVIDEFRPDIVHSHEIQHGGALVHAVRQRTDTHDFRWLVTNWGSDIYWFGRQPPYVSTIRAVVRACDYYCAECHRDVALARAFGLQGRVIGVWPVAGGLDLDHAGTLRAPGPTSSRRAIAVKGVVNSYGQGELAFAALQRCADLIGGWELCIYQLDPRLEEPYREFAAQHDLRLTIASLVDAKQSSHDELLAMHGRARVSLALNRSDALSTSFLEAMAMGAFPVQSASACGSEITPPGHGALFVPATDLDAVTMALRRALIDDELIDAAPAINARACAEHLDRRRIRARVLDGYERILADAALAAA